MYGNIDGYSSKYETNERTALGFDYIGWFSSCRNRSVNKSFRFDVGKTISSRVLENCLLRSPATVFKVILL